MREASATARFLDNLASTLARYPCGRVGTDSRCVNYRSTHAHDRSRRRHLLRRGCRIALPRFVRLVEHSRARVLVFPSTRAVPGRIPGVHARKEARRVRTRCALSLPADPRRHSGDRGDRDSPKVRLGDVGRTLGDGSSLPSKASRAGTDSRRFSPEGIEP